MEGSSIVKSGDVCLQVKGLLKTSWVQKFCVLYKKTEDHHPYFELFENKDAFMKYKQRKGKTDVKKVELQHTRSIRSSSHKTSKGGEYHIEIKCRTQKHVLMFTNEAESLEWYTRLNSTVDITDRGEDGSSTGATDQHHSLEPDSDNDTDEVITLNRMYGSTDEVQRFTVEVETTPLANICDIVGNMTMLVATNEIGFEHPKTRQIKYRFMMNWMRRFGKVGTQFYFECGRNCPNGEGTVKCNTESARFVHQLVTSKSSSKGKTVIPHKPPEVEKEQALGDNSVKSVPAITAPSLAFNAGRKHPGQKKTPTLIPIVNTENDEENHSPSSPLRMSGGRRSLKDDGEIFEKKQGQISDIAKELEGKLQINDGNPGSFKKAEEGKEAKVSKSMKEDKRREKEERKEREKREKEERKERERREKEEKKERERKEKESRKKSKRKEENGHTPAVQPSLSCKNYIYDEPEIRKDNKVSAADTAEILYDEATVPADNSIRPIVGDYAEPYQVKKTSQRKPDLLVYDEATPVDNRSSSVNSAPQPVEYAQPYARRGSSKSAVLQSDSMAYTYVKHVEEEAWKSHGRTEEEECFEENYTNIKSAREQINQGDAPPIPSRGYSESDSYEVDDTYNRLDLKHLHRQSCKQSENLYGEASAKKVEPFNQVVPVRMTDDTDSEGEEFENEYATADFEGYEDPQYIKDKGKAKPVVEAYEEAQPTVRNSSKPVPIESLYEEVP